jgi:hypothetical protein
MIDEPVVVTLATAYETRFLMLRLVGRALREALRIVAKPVPAAECCANRSPVLLFRRVVVAEWV